METTIVKLKNRYTGEIVFTKTYDDVIHSDGLEFIRAYSPDKPERLYYVNRKAFDILDK